MKPLDARGEHSAAEWEAHKDLFIQLYHVEDKSLKEVREIMGAEHGFYATEKQFKTRITKWDLDKNIKDSDMKVILRKGLKRKLDEGKDSVFEVHGRPVQDHKMERFARRKKISEDQILENEILTPPYIDCYTPMAAGVGEREGDNPQTIVIEDTIPESAEYAVTFKFESCFSKFGCKNCPLRNGEDDIYRECSFFTETITDARIEDFEMVHKLHGFRKQHTHSFEDSANLTMEPSHLDAAMSNLLEILATNVSARFDPLWFNLPRCWLADFAWGLIREEGELRSFFVCRLELGPCFNRMLVPGISVSRQSITMVASNLCEVMRDPIIDLVRKQYSLIERCSKDLPQSGALDDTRGSDLPNAEIFGQISLVQDMREARDLDDSMKFKPIWFGYPSGWVWYNSARTMRERTIDFS